VEIACIDEDALGHYLLQEFAATLKEGDGLVGLCCSVVRFVGLGDRDDCGSLPWVCREGDGSIEKACESLWVGSVRPFEQFVPNACRSRCRLIGGVGKGCGNLLIGDGGERVWWCRRWVIWVGGRNGLGDLRKETVGEDLADV